MRYLDKRSSSHRGRTITTTALITDKLSHEMILSWRDCIQQQIVPQPFPLPNQEGQINEIQSEAEAIKEAITNKFNIIRNNISHNKILTEPGKVKLKDTKIIPYRASTTRQIPIC